MPNKKKKGTKEVFDEEKKEITEKKKRVRKTKKELKQLSKDEQERANKIRISRLIETVIIVIIAFIMVVLLLNKTFFREEYTGKVDNQEFKINIPLLYYFVKDKDGVIEFKTLRKSDYDREYFDEYLGDLDKYDCNGKTFYYDKKYNLIINSIKVNKKFVMKTILIDYDIKDANEICK